MLLSHCLRADRIQVDERRANTILQAHPLLLSALLESYWRQGAQQAGSPLTGWPAGITDPIVQAFDGDDGGPQAAAANVFRAPAFVRWHHMIYAYLVENTRIHDIFLKALELYRAGETLGVPTNASQSFWRATEAFVYSDPLPTSIFSVTSRARPDEVAHRVSKYWALLGLELSHATILAQMHPYTKPDSANTEWQDTLGSFGHAGWRALVNARNVVGPNDSDAEEIVIHAQRLSRIAAARRQHGNVATAEFRAVAVMSWLHLAVSYDSPIVVDLGASMGQGGSAADRLGRIADRIAKITGDSQLTVHPAAQAMFDLASPLSLLMRLTELGLFNTQSGATWLYQNPFGAALLRQVLALYPLAMGQDLKATKVAVTKTATGMKPGQVSPQPAQYPKVQQLPQVASNVRTLTTPVTAQAQKH